MALLTSNNTMQICKSFFTSVVPRNDKNKTWHMYNIHLRSLCILFNVFWTVWVPARTTVPEHHNCCRSVCSLVESRMHLKFSSSFTEPKKNYPFLTFNVFAQSLTSVFFSLSGKSQGLPNTAQGAERKVLSAGGNKVFWCWFLFPLSKNPKEERRCRRSEKVFFLSLLFLSRFRLSLETAWSACLIGGWV